jgi:hypothetical protein
MIKLLIFAVWLAMFVPQDAESAKIKPFATVVPMQVLCTKGGPEYLILELMEKYNEVPAYTMQISVDRPLPLFMIITENKNNPSSTIILGNPNLNVSCIFMTAKDSLLPTEAESLPTKQPDPEEKPKLGV